MPFLSELVVQEPTSGKGEWVLTAPLKYQGNREAFTVPMGFGTDFASVPRAFWSVFPPYGKHTKSAVLHDWLYVTQPVSRKDADGLFRRTMREAGVSRWRRYTMWAAVRAAGWVYWRRSAKRLRDSSDR